MLAAFVVNTSIDDASGTVDGFVSFREAIIAAETNAPFGDAMAGDVDGDTITFSPLLLAHTIQLTNGECSITDDLFIDGGTLGITLDAQNQSRIFQMDSGQTVKLANLNLIHGSSNANGGALVNLGSGDLVIEHVSFQSNDATGDGGAIYSAGGQLFISSSNFSNNVASGANGSGGALVSTQGNVNISDSTFHSNTASHAGGAIEIVDGTVELIDVDLTANMAGLSGTAPGYGGALHVAGSNGTLVTIRGGVIDGNTAASEGGGLWNQSGSTLIVRDATTISNNVALGAAPDEGGGGIFNHGGTTRVLNSTILDNSASGSAASGGGVFSSAGVLNIRNARIQGNEASRAGGGVEVVSGYAALWTVTLGGAIAEQANVAGPAGAAAPGDGGGLHITAAAAVLIDGGLFEGNVAAHEGGGLWNSANANVLVRNGTIFRSNVASGDAADDGGGAIFNDGGWLSIVDSTVVNNQADGAAGSGGGLLSSKGNVYIAASTFSDNRAERAGGGIEVFAGQLTIHSSTLDMNVAGFSSSTPSDGGGVHIGGLARTDVFDSIITGNVAMQNGGGFWNQTGGSLVIRSSVISSNEARGDAADNGGGGIFNDGGIVRIIGSTLRENLALGVNGSGGAILSTDGVLSIRDGSSILSNQAVRAGGGIEMINGYTRIDNSALGSMTEGNRVGAPNGNPGDGGGLHVSGNLITNYVVLVGATVEGNFATNAGGGLWNQTNARVVVRNGSSIRANVAAGDGASNGGGGIFNNRGIIRVIGSTISANQAIGIDAAGGGILSLGGIVNVRDASSFTGNAATSQGGGAALLGGFSLMSGSTVGGAGSGAANTANFGAGVFVSGGPGTVFVMDTSIVEGNQAHVSGGGLWSGDSAFVLLRNGTMVRSNSASGLLSLDGGGGIFVADSSQVVLTLATILNNSADGTLGNGGGIFVQSGGAAYLTSSFVTSNSATINGGGVFNEGVFTSDLGSLISFNVATLGGGIFTAAGATTNVVISTVISNIPDNLA